MSLAQHRRFVPWQIQKDEAFTVNGRTQNHTDTQTHTHTRTNIHQQKLRPYRNQSIDLLWKSIDWILHDTKLYRKVFANGICQGIKEKLLVKPEVYSETRQTPKQRPLQKLFNGLNPLTNFAKKTPSHTTDWAIITIKVKICVDIK